MKIFKMIEKKIEFEIEFEDGSMQFAVPYPVPKKSRQYVEWENTLPPQDAVIELIHDITGVDKEKLETKTQTSVLARVYNYYFNECKASIIPPGSAEK